LAYLLKARIINFWFTHFAKSINGKFTMLQSNSTSLRELIIMELAKCSSIEVSVFQKMLERRNLKFTRQAIYKELRNLEKSGVVFRHEGKYGLLLTWILSLVTLADDMYDTHIDGLSIDSLFGEGRRKETWSFRDTLKLQYFWTQVIFLLYKDSSSKLMRQWIPHPWFSLAQREKSLQFFDAIRIGGYRMKSIIGGTTYLDYEYSRSVNLGDAYQCFFGESPLHEERSRYYGVIDDFLITVEFDAGMTTRIEQLFGNVKGANEVSPSSIVSLFASPGSHKLSLEHGTRNAARIRRIFDEYFID